MTTQTRSWSTPVSNNPLKTVVIWGIILGGSWLVSVLLGPLQNYLGRLSPVSIWSLPPHAWRAVILTMSTACIAWVIGVTVGYVIATAASIAELAHEANDSGRTLGEIAWQWFRHVKVIFDGFFVVPLVLTVMLTWTILSQLNLSGALPRWMILAGIVIVSSVALAGQRVFVAVYDAVVSASTDDRMLAVSLAHSTSSRTSGGSGYAASIGGGGAHFAGLFRQVRFLVACRIELVAQALEQAFHLAVVSVVIAETVIPGLYEYLFAQTGVSPRWSGGIGKVILDGQNATNPTLIAGAVWVILAIDAAVVMTMRGLMYTRWLQPYRSDK